MRDILILISILLLSSPVICQETGVLFFSFENGEFVYSDEGNDDNVGKYEGEIENGKPNGQGTFTFTDGIKWVGEFRGNKPWNVSLFDKKGNIKMKWVNGMKH